MDGDLVARVAGHRETFKKLLDRAGEIVGAQVLPSSSGKSVDLYLMKPPAVEMFHVSGSVFRIFSRLLVGHSLYSRGCNWPLSVFFPSSLLVANCLSRGLYSHEIFSRCTEGLAFLLCAVWGCYMVPVPNLCPQLCTVLGLRLD